MIWSNKAHVFWSSTMRTRSGSLRQEAVAMTMYALIENKPDGKYTASLIGWPDVTA